MDRNQQRRLKGGLSQGLGGRGAGGLLSSEATVVAGKTAVNQPQGGGAAGGGGVMLGFSPKGFAFLTSSLIPLQANHGPPTLTLSQPPCAMTREQSRH